jgi:phage antirepressor YoqD-like protein
MKYLKIQNDGVLDIRLVALMGGTTKSNDKYKIGQFGTGLKYTLAFLFRNNIDFKIMAGTEEIKMHIEKEHIRDEEFEIICINGQRTSITTKMGDDWQAWMIIRELWCNALDEGGAVRATTELIEGYQGKTCFYIQVDRQIYDVCKNWNKYFIHEQIPIFKNDQVAIYPAGDSLCIYKQGVLIKKDEHVKSVFSYDVFDIDINELREYNGSLAFPIVQCLSNCNEQAASYFLENVTTDHYEGDKMDYNWWLSWGKAWTSVIGSGKLIYQKVLDDIIARGGTPDLAGLIIVPENVYKGLTKQFEGIGALRVASKISDFYETFNEETESRIKQALVILEHCGYPMHPELTFVFGFFEDKTIQAQIHMDTKKIYVSNAMIQQPLVTIVAMLIEENEHFNTGLNDKTREFQQHFINLYTRQLLAGSQVEI